MMNTEAAPADYAKRSFTLVGFEAVQLFDRMRMGHLWAKRQSFDAGQVSLLKSLWDKKDKGTLKCKTPTSYKLSTNGAGKLGYGRLYGSGGSLEKLERAIRATLCVNLYDDVDVVNCHPTLAYQMSEKLFDKSMPMLKHYCDNRKAVIASWVEAYGMSESDAKDIPIRLLNNGTIAHLTKSSKNAVTGETIPAKFPEEILGDTVISSIQEECRTFINDMIASKKHDELYKWCRKNEDNYRGSFISNIYQTEERKCLEALVWKLQSLSYCVDVLSYDGCMVRKNKVTDAALRECEQTIKEWTGYTIHLKIKPMEDEVIPLEELQEESSNFDDGYAAMKLEWERNHFYFKPTGTIVEQNDDGSFGHLKLDHATEAFNMWKLKAAGNEKPEPFLKKWREDPTRRIVDRIVMKMEEDCAPNEASAFRGFHYKRLEIEVDEEQRAKYIATYNSLIRNLCAGDEEIYTALLKNFARCVQRPLERPDICIVLSSKEHGVGKETVVNILSSVIGKGSAAHYTSDEAFWDKHDTKKEGAILIHLEEAGATNKKMADQLKARITSTVTSIRPCGVSAYDVDNNALYVMTTNKALPIKLEESDRRFFIINCQGPKFSTREEKIAHWNSVYSQINTDAFIKTVGEYLASVDLTGFSPRAFPETEYKKSLMETTKSPEAQFLEQWVHDAENGDEIATLYNRYKSFCLENGLPFKMNSNSFSQTIVRESDYYTKSYHKETRRALYKSKNARPIEDDEKVSDPR